MSNGIIERSKIEGDVRHRRAATANTRRTLAGLALVLAAAVLYFATLDNGLQTGELFGGDLITHQYAQVQARPSNAPGYPVFTIGGWLWFHGIRSLLQVIGVGSPNPIPILSSYSMLWALLALWLLFQIICLTTESEHKPNGNIVAALLVSAFYAVTYFFWYYATTTEQYSSAIAQTLGIIIVLLMWLRKPDSFGLLLALAFLCGLSLAHMLTVAFLVPPVVVTVLRVHPALLRSPKAVVGAIFAALAPLASYAWVYSRGSAHPEWWGGQYYGSAAEWFWSFVSTSQGREELMWSFEPGRPFLGNGFPALIGIELTWFVVIAGLVGIYFLPRPLPFVLFSTLALYVLFSWTYRFGNWFQVILPAYALLMIGVGAFADKFQESITGARRHGDQDRWQRLANHALAAAPLALLVIAIFWRFDASLARTDSRNRPEDSALDNAALYLSATLPADSAVFASVEDALAMQYLTQIWGLRADLDVVSADEAARLADGRALFSTWEAAPTLAVELGNPELTRLVVKSPDWVQVIHNPLQDATEDVMEGARRRITMNEVIDAETALDTIEAAPAPDGYPVTELQHLNYDVTLVWRLLKNSWPQNLSISVRPTFDGQFIPNPQDPEKILQSDRSLPAQLLLDDRYTAGTIRDPYRVTFPSEVGGQTPGVAVILYRVGDEGFEDVARFDIRLPEGSSN